MWADTLLGAEQAFLLRFIIWGASCTALGLAILAVGAVRRRRTPMLDHFAIQTAAWGAVAFAIALAGWWRADLRDHAGAVQLARLVQGLLALDAGMIGAGLALWFRGWRRSSAGTLGAGVGLLTQGTAWLVLHASFAVFLRNAS